MQELLRQATTAQLSNDEVEVLNQERIKELYTEAKNEDLGGGVDKPKDGQEDQVGVTEVSGKAATNVGGRMFEESQVKKI